MKSKKIWGPRDEYRTYLRQAKRLFPTMLEHIDYHRIFLVGFIARRSRHVAKITRNKNPWAILIPDYDYVIEFHDPQFRGYNEAMKVYVVFHELFHIPEGGFLFGNPQYRKLKDHDVEEFNLLISTYGLNLENVDMVLKGEKALFKHLKGKHTSDEIRRFPRLPKIK